MYFSTLKPKQKSRHFADIFKGIFLKENSCLLIEVCSKGPN